MAVKSGIRKKLVTTMLVLVLAVLTLMTYWQITSQQQVLRAELRKQTGLMLQNLHSRAMYQAHQLQFLAQEDIASFNLHELNDTLRETAAAHTELEDIVVVDNEQRIVIHSSTPEHQQNLLSSLIRENAKNLIVENKDTQLPASYMKDSSKLLSEAERLVYSLPLNLGNKPWGQLVLSYSLMELRQKIEASQLENEKLVQQQTWYSIILAISVLLLTYIAISRLSSRFSTPIVQLTQFAQQLSKGDFSLNNQVIVESKDEVSVLATQFSEMANNLKQAYQDLEKYNELLEQRVQERTQQLNQRNKELVQAMKDLEESQQQLVHSEKMAALGQLVASIAHEVNTPLGAIQASAGNATKFYTAYASGLRPLLSENNAGDLNLFFWLLEHSRPAESLTTREERSAKRQARQSLDQAGIESSSEIADMLVDMGLADQTAEIIPMLTCPNHLRAIESAYQLNGLIRCNQTIYSATSRASKIMYALKSFARQDQFGEKSEIDINEGINTVLVLYNGLMKHGCEVVKDYGTLPALNCHADELNQVWTNLIHNALQAMEYKGVLTIATELTEENNRSEIRVHITDTGHGIPSDIQTRVWESFFTTKVSGEGSGLGLGICKRIIDKHDGRISFTSKPGSTTFTVALPLETEVQPVETDAAQA